MLPLKFGLAGMSVAFLLHEYRKTKRKQSLSLQSAVPELAKIKATLELA